MSDWIGPNCYRIENFQNRGAAVAVKDGSPNVVQKSNMADEHDMENQWIIALAGSGTSKRDEFLIINRGNKMFLTCSAPAPTRVGPLTMTQNDPLSTLCRWNITPTRNNTGTFLITPVVDSTLRLGAAGLTTADSAAITVNKWPIAQKGTWWYFELAFPQYLDALDLGAAPKHCGH
ncbi:hypothetical protein Q7P36_009209 [Cladosporium allicinum]